MCPEPRRTMPVIAYRGSAPRSIVEGSGAGDWVANLELSGDLSRLVSIETAGPAAAFFSAGWDPALGVATIRPDARLDFEAFSAAGALPQVEIALRFVFDDGSRQDDGPRFQVAVLDRDDTPPVALAFERHASRVFGDAGLTRGTLYVNGERFQSFTRLYARRGGVWQGVAVQVVE